MYYTTLNKIRTHRPCCEGWVKLLRHLGKIDPDDEPVSLLTILESNGIEDAVWALRAVEDPACERDARLFAVRCVRQVQHLLQDQRSLDALDVAERYAVGMASDNELQAAQEAAWAAARKVAWNSAQVVAWAATCTDARAAAWAATRCASWNAVWVVPGAVAEADFRALFCADESTCPA